ncbi:MAG: poly-gamma-glutamate hydrolase family protein, partial [Acidimicrobiia bacterium]|nr:poly-gamma-glutamate hydrolase family protein [Acidimicrobiia bacterium]
STAAPASLAELLARPGVREETELGSRFGFMAVHGGALEAMTDVIAGRAAALSGASYYAVIHPEAERHHLASTRFRPGESDALARFIGRVEVVVSVHGYGRRGRWTQLLAGGSNRELAMHVALRVREALPGYDVVTDLDAIPAELRGMRADNPVNLPPGGGVQLELPPRVRGQSPRSPLPGPDGLSPVIHDLAGALAAAASSWPLTD